MDDITKQLLFTVATPIVAAPVVGLIGAARKAPHDGKPRRDRLAARLPLLLAGCVAFAVVGMHGLVREGWFAVVWVALAAGAIGVVASFLPRRAWSLIGLAVATGGATLAVTWHAFIPADPWWFKVIMGVAPVVFVLVLEPVARRVAGPTVPFVLSGAAGMTAAITAASGAGAMTIAPASGALAVALLGLAILAVWRRGLVVADGAIFVTSAMLVAGPVIGRLHLDDDAFPEPAFALPAASTLLLGVLLVPPLRRRSIAVTVAVLAAAIAVGSAVWAGTSTSSASDDSPEASMYGY